MKLSPIAAAFGWPEGCKLRIVRGDTGLAVADYAPPKPGYWEGAYAAREAYGVPNPCHSEAFKTRAPEKVRASFRQRFRVPADVELVPVILLPPR